MSRKRKLQTERFVVATEKPHTLRIAVAAFLIGAVATFLVMYLARPATPGTAPVISTGAPDVRQVPPAQAAATLGNWEYDRGNWPEAAAQYERALAAGLDNADIRTDLGTAYRHLGQGDRALEQYGIAQRMDRFHQNSLFNQAVVYAEVMNNPPKALATAREFLQRFPQSRGAESAKRLIAELENRQNEAGKKLGEYLNKPVPAREMRPGETAP